MSIVRFFQFIWMFFSVCTWAGPTMDVVDSCHNGEPVSKSVKLKELAGVAPVSKLFPNCNEQYQVSYYGKIYGYATCEDKQYLIVDGVKFLAENSINYSINKGIAPGDAMSAGSTIFYGLEKNGESYVCIATPLFDSGKLAKYMVFYLISSSPQIKGPEVGFYFLDKIEW